jgi:cell wall-associated NlpC family hydrolase
LNEAKRERVIGAAESWLETPFHDVAGVKGVGVDCAHLLARVFEDAGLMEHLSIKPYSPQFFMHRSEERFVAQVLEYAEEISDDEIQPADIVIYKIGRCFAHGAIICEWPTRIIHAYKAARRVIASHAEHGELIGRERRFFRFIGGRP